MFTSNSEMRIPGEGLPQGVLASGPSAPIDDVLSKVEQLLERGETAEALALLHRSGQSSPWFTNARGVCQLRQGAARDALQTFRGLVTIDIHLRSDVPEVFIANFAAAMSAVGNFEGFLFAMGRLQNSSHPAAVRYREAYTQWLAGLGFWGRLRVRAHFKQFRITAPLGDLR